MITVIRVFLRRLFGRNTDPQLDEEIATHIDMLARDFELKGMTPEAARAAARREFGSVLQMLEVHRDTRRLPSLNSIAQDLGYALRQVRMNRGFVVAAVITLALGIGANTAIFDVLDRIVLRSLPVKDPDRLAALRLEQAFGVPLLRQMSARQTSVEGLFASGESGIRQASVDGRAIAEPVILYVTGNYFRLLGTQPQIGRLLADTDDVATAPAVIVVSDRFWRREFGGQSSTALGQSIRLNDKISAVIVGVTRPDFYGERLGQIPDAWIPMGLIAQLSPGLDSRSTSWLAPMARLRPDVPLDQAQRELETLLNQLMPDFGLVLRGVSHYRLQLVSAPQGLSNLHMEFSKPLWLLMGLVIFVVLIACCNLANLLLARGMARAHEIGIRLAIGASRRRIVRQLFVESLVIASAGGACGLAIAYWGSNALLALALAGQKQDLIAGFGWRVASFSILLSIVSACIFGLLPALTASRINLNSALQSATRNVGSRSQHFATKAFGVAQLAISMLLVAGACLLVSSFWRLLHQDMGYSRSGILTFQPAFDASTFSFFRNPILPQTLNEQLNAVPGVQAAAYLQGGPLGAITETAAIALPDRPSEKSDGLRGIDVSCPFGSAARFQWRVAAA